MAPVRCPLCGEPHAACGQRTTTDGIVITEARRTMAGKLKKYEVTVNGRWTTTLLLTEEDAKKRGLVSEPKEQGATKKATKPANKAVTPKNKGAGNVDTAGHSR